jgi:hypothetical protein
MRHRLMRAAVLSGSILSFVPVLWLVKDSTPAQADDPTPTPAVPQRSRDYDDDRRERDDDRFERRRQDPSFSSPNQNPSTSPQAVPNPPAPQQQQSAPMPRAHSRSRAS